MFSKIQISLMRAFFWSVSMVTYWGLIFMAWWDTRFSVFLWSSVIVRLSERRSYSSIMGNIAEMEGRAWEAISAGGTMETEFFIVPLIMSLILFIAPFVVRRDLKAPARGIFILPFAAIMCYIAVSLINIVLAASLNGGIYYILLKKPSPDFFMFMIHPLYLIFPLFRSAPGFLSQCIYLAFIVSVLSAPGMERDAAESGGAYDYDGEDQPEDGTDDDWDRSACVMEMDRLTRILNSKFEAPQLIHEVRSDVAEYINRPSQALGDVKLGIAHYKIVLTEAKNSLQRIISENRNRPDSDNAFLFIVNELEHMSYISDGDAAAMREFIQPKPNGGGAGNADGAKT